MTSRRSSFLIPEEIADQLGARTDSSVGGVSGTLREILGRYFAILADGRRRLSEVLTNEELVDAVSLGNGTIYQPHTLDGILADAQDAEAHEVPYPEALPSLRDKLSRASLGEHAALVDAVERYWIAHSTGMQVDRRAILE